MTSLSQTPARAWKPALSAWALSLASLLVLFRVTALSMVEIWARSGTFTHCFLVAPICAWLVWRIRHRLVPITPRPDVRTIVLLSLACFAWLLGQLAAVGVVAQFALVTLAILLVPAIFGWRIARLLAFPLLFLYFSVPFGEFAMPQLMEWTAKFTVLGLRASGVPVFQEGLQFVIPSGSWSVVEACSGVRYLIASLTLGMLFAYLNYRSPGRRLSFVAVSLIVPILANWMRAYLIVMLGHFSSNALAAGVDHLIYGWLFFGVVILLMFAVGGRWSDVPLSLSEDEDARIPQSARATPVREFWKIAAVVIPVLMAAPLAEWHLLQGASAAPPVFPDLSRMENGWRQSDGMPGPAWEPAYANPSAKFNASYAAKGQNVGLYIGYYRRQGPDRKLISSENALVRSDDPIWARVASGLADTRFSGQIVPMRSAGLRAGRVGRESQRLIVRQFFWIDGHLTVSDAKAKLLTALALLSGRGDDSAVVILYAPESPDNGGEAALTAFIEANAARLLGALDAMRMKR
jgi:exosortase A